MADNRIRRRSLLTAAAALPLGMLAGPAFARTQTAAALAVDSSDAEGAARHARRRTLDVIPLPKGIRPEGITSGPGMSFFVGSLTDGRIVTGDFRRSATRVLLPGAPGRQLRGLYYDRRTELVWAAGNVGNVSHVWAVDAQSGTVAADVVVPGAGFLNDLVADRNSVWVTDSRVDRLTRIPTRRGWPSDDAPTFVTLGGQWPAGDGTAINANGIRALQDGRLLLNNSRVGGLWVVHPRTGMARPVPVRGGPGITGGDGLEIAGTTVYVVRGSGQYEVSALRLVRSDDGLRARWLGRITDPSLDVPSTATFAGGHLWAVNARFGVPEPDTAAYWITRLPARAR